MADGSGRIPVIVCVRDAWGFLAAHWRLFLPAAAITAVLGQAGRAFVALSPPGEGQTLLSDALGNLVIILPAVITSVLFTAAVLRKAVRDEFAGPTGLAAGADELRLLGLMAAFACVFAPFFMLAWFLIGTFVLARIASTPEELQALLQDPDALATALGPSGAAAFVLFSFLILGALLYVYSRLFVTTAATIGERRTVMFQVWSWSRGNVGRVLAAMMLTWLPAYLIDSLAFELGLALLQPVATEQSAAFLGLILNTLVTFVAAMVSIPQIALAAILYKGLRPADFVAK